MLGKLLLLPIAPLQGVVWVADRLGGLAAREMNDPAAIRRAINEVENDYRRGLIDEDTYEEKTDALLQHLVEVQQPGVVTH